MNTPEQNYNRSLKITKIIAFACPVIAITIALAYFFALRLDFDYSIGHFAHGSILFYIAMAGIGTGIILPAVAALFTKKKISITKPHDESRAVSFFAVFAAVMAVFGCFKDMSAILGYYNIPKLALGATLGLIVIALAALHLIFPSRGTSKTAQLLFTLSVLALDLEILANYFNQTMPLNSPVRYIIMLGEISVMLFFVSEARLSFGLQTTADGETSKRALFPFFLFTNAVTGSVALGVSVGGILFKLFCETDGTALTTAIHPSLFRLAMYVSIGGIAIARLFSACRITSAYVKSTSEGALLPEEIEENEEIAEAEESATEETEDTIENYEEITDTPADENTNIEN